MFTRFTGVVAMSKAARIERYNRRKRPGRPVASAKHLTAEEIESRLRKRKR